MSSAEFDWKREIVRLALVHQQIRDLDIKHVWNHALPNVAASEGELLEVERALGCPLDPKFRAFLSYANGWDCFYQHVDLFGTKDLIGGPRANEARRSLEILEAEGVFRGIGLSRRELLPIAVSRSDIDMFLLVLPAGRGAGGIIWCAGDVVEQFDDFERFFLAMIDYNRAEIAYLLRERKLT